MSFKKSEGGMVGFSCWEKVGIINPNPSPYRGIEFKIDGKNYAIIREEGRVEKDWPEGTTEHQKELFNQPEDIQFLVEDIETGQRGMINVCSSVFASKLHQAKMEALARHPGVDVQPVDFIAARYNQTKPFSPEPVNIHRVTVGPDSPDDA